MDTVSIRAKARLEQLSRPLSGSHGSSFLIDDILVQKPKVRPFPTYILNPLPIIIYPLRYAILTKDLTLQDKGRGLECFMMGQEGV